MNSGLPITSEKFKILRLGDIYRILDSFSFLPTSLAALTESLCKSRSLTGAPLKYLKQSGLANDAYGVFSQDIYDLCLKKLSFPFSLAGSREEMKKWTCLPPKVFYLVNEQK